MARVDFSKDGGVLLLDNNNNGNGGITNQETGRPLWLSSGTFARVDPELYFERHVRKGLRPNSTRKFLEFRKIHEHLGSLNGEAAATTTTKDSNSSITEGGNCFGSCVVRAGNTSVVCGIVIGTTETRNGGGIYPNVEILRGGFNSAPSTEEMIISQRVSELIKAMNFSEKNFQVRLLQDEDEKMREVEEEEENKEDGEEVYEKGIDHTRWLVYTAHVQVLSRTGPPFDLVWAAVMGALKDVEIPLFEIDDEKDLYCVQKRTGVKLEFPFEKIPYSSTFGISTVDTSDGAERFVEGIREEEEDNDNDDDEDDDDEKKFKIIVLADPDGEIEEACVRTQMSVVSDEEGTLYGFSFGVVGDCKVKGQDLNRQGLVVGRSEIEQVLTSAQKHALELSQFR